MVGVSVSVNLTLHHKVQKFSSGIGSPEWSQKKGRKTIVAVVVVCNVMTNSLEATSVNYDRLFTELIAHGASTTTTA